MENETTIETEAPIEPIVEESSETLKPAEDVGTDEPVKVDEDTSEEESEILEETTDNLKPRETYHSQSGGVIENDYKIQ